MDNEKKEKKTEMDIRGRIIDGEVFIHADDMIIFMSQSIVSLPVGVIKKAHQFWIDWFIRYKAKGLKEYVESQK